MNHRLIALGRRVSSGLPALAVAAIVLASITAYAVLGVPSATMSLNSGASATTTTTVSVNSDVTDAAEMSFSPVFSQVDAGSQFACGIAMDGSLWTWGTVAGRVLPRPVRLGSDSDWKSLSVGGTTGAAIKNDGTLWTWTSNSMPARVNTWTWSSVSVGGSHILAIRSDTGLYAWGSNSWGQLGIGSTTQQVSPYLVSTGWEKVSAGSNHSVGVKTGGFLYSWGDNTYGQLGDNTTVRRLSPTAPMYYGSNCSTPVAGYGFTIVSYNTGEWRSAGRGDYGQLGIGYSPGSPLFTNLLSTPWSDVKAEGAHGVGLKSDGSIWTWGRNSAGSNNTYPVRIGTRNDWAAIAIGYNTDYAMSGAATYSWGEGPYGCLGDGTLTTRVATPAPLEYWQTYAANASATLPKIDGTHAVTVRYRDAAQTTETALTDSIILDCTPPSGTLLINYGASDTNSTTVNIRISVPANDATEMSVQGGPWIPWAYDSTTTLTPGDGVKTVAVKIRDIALNESDLSDTINLDSTPPSGTMALNSGATVSRTRWTVANPSVTGASAVYVDADMWRKVDGGLKHMLALDSEGNLWGWGENTYGAVGTGTFKGDGYTALADGIGGPTKVLAPVKWQTFDAAAEYSLAIDTMGDLYSWGRNAYGQLGNGTTANLSLPVRVDNSGSWKSVSGATYHALGLKDDGTLWVWGQGSYGQLGQGDTVTHYAPIRIGSDADWKSISAGASSSYAIKDDGTLWAWGNGAAGALGLGTTSNRYVPTQVGTDADWAAVSSGGGHVLAVKTNGTLWAWGSNTYGVLGLGDTTQRLVPTQVGTESDWTTVDATRYGQSLAIKTDGSVWTWGDSYFGQLGRVFTGYALTPGRVMDVVDGWNSAVVGPGCLIGVTGTGRMAGAGHSYYVARKPGLGNSPIPSSVGWFPNAFKAAPVLLADILTPQSATVTYSDAVGNELTLSDSITYSPATAPLMTINNGAATAGGNTDLNLAPSVPGGIGMRLGKKWEDVESGFGWTMLHVKDGPVEFAGNGQNAQRGDGTLKFTSLQFGFGGDTRVWSKYAAGEEHSLAIAPDGSLWVWGDNAQGELGVAQQYAASPVNVNEGSRYRDVFAGLNTSFAIRDDGTLWAWGLNDHGQLGDGTKTSHAVPTQIGTVDTWTYVSSWGPSTVGLRTDGSLWVWGLNTSGQHGQGDLTERLAMSQVMPGTTFTAAECGSGHILALDSTGALWAWGAGGSGQIGDGSSVTRTTPVRVGLYSYKTVAAGVSSSFAVRSDGTLWAWGNNSSGQLGDGSATTRSVPTQVGTANNWEFVDSGGTTDLGQEARHHTVASTLDGRIYTWGYNGWGQLGDGTTTTKYSPTEIVRSPYVAPMGNSVQSLPWASGDTTIHACYTESDGSPLWLHDTIYVTPPVPVVCGVLPVFGSVAETSTPEISAKIIVNPAALPATVEVRMDGILIPSAYDAAFSLKVTAYASGLSDDMTHTVEVKVTDAAGSVGTGSTAFLLEKGTRMSHWDAETDCRTCHGATVPHTNSVCYAPSSNPEERCLVCHMGVHTTLPEQSYPRYNDCQCHYYATPAWTHRLDPAKCKTCHSMFHSGQDPNPPETVRHTVEVPTCTPCHRHELRFEHARRMTDSGVRYDCNTCHTSTSTRVQNAITGGDTQCSACHDTIDHQTPHDGTIDAACQACHSGNLDDEHVTSRGLDCEACHSSTDPAVIAAIAGRDHACSACHVGNHPHPAAQFTSGPDRTACAKCHSADLVVEHTKPASSSAAAGCEACHAAGGPRTSFATWDGTCQTGACHPGQSAGGLHGFTVPAVDYASACTKCHLDFAGSHPYHNATSNCGAMCHSGWGAALAADIPVYSAALGARTGGFASSASASTAPALLHIIHSRSRWMGEKATANSSCKSCHAVAACDACHEGPLDPAHQGHASTQNPNSVASVSRGVMNGNESDTSGFAPAESSPCGDARCHDTAGVAVSAPGLKDDKVHIGNPANDYLDNPTVTKSAGWIVVKASAYTMGQTSTSNVKDATLTVPFTGTQVALVADKDPFRGIAEILIDGVSVGTVDLFQSTTANQVEVWRSATLPAGEHAITVKATGTKRSIARAAYVRVDQFKIHADTPGSVAPTCASCH